VLEYSRRHDLPTSLFPKRNDKALPIKLQVKESAHQKHAYTDEITQEQETVPDVCNNYNNPIPR
jgi:hypothetical protein